MLDNRVFIINRSELEDRFDPIFYASDLAKFNTNIFKSVLLKSIVKYFKSGFGAGKQEQTDAKNGIIQIRPTNIDENGFLKYDKNIYLPIDKNSIRIEVDDIIFNNTNSQELVGKTAILKENKELTFSNHITIIRVRKEAILPDYLWIILNMYQRNRIFYSICTNWNNQSGIGLELLKKLKIPLPPLEIQQQIVDLYEKAYTEKQQKEAEAQRLLDSIDDYLLEELGITLPKEEEHLPQNTNKNSSYNLDNDNPLVKKGRLFLANLSEVTGKRIDPDYYSIYYKKIITKVEKGKYPMDTINNNCINVFSGKTPSSSEYSKDNTIYPIIKVSSYTDYKIDVEKVAFATNKQPFNILKGDIFILSAAHQAEYVGKHIKYLEETPKYLTSFVGELLCIRVNEEKLSSNYLFSLLNTKYYKILINREKTGQTSHIYPKDIENIKIPLPPLEKQNEIATHISQIRNKANILKQEGKEFLEQAKQDVEQMILGD